MNNLIADFQRRYPELVQQMKESNHHYSETELNPYHLEGDIFTHTALVCLEALRANLSRSNQIACLLHDIGKPACRTVSEDRRRVHFIGHEGYSAHLAIDIMKDFGLTEKEIIHNFQLIAMHTDPFKMNSVAFSSRLIYNLALWCDLRVVSSCDHKGRFCEEVSQGRELSSKVQELELQDSYENEVIVLIGLPCSGKSTVRAEFPNHEVISRDDIIESLYEGETYNEKFAKSDDKEIRKVLEARKKALISEKKDVIIDMTNLTRKSRRKRLSSFPKSYKRTAIVCLTGLAEIKRRNEERKKVGKFIGWDVFERMMKSTYPPMFDEFEEIDWRLS